LLNGNQCQPVGEEVTASILIVCCLSVVVAPSGNSLSNLKQ